MKQLGHILQTNTAVAKALGQSFVNQLGHIFVEMLNLYRVYSEAISAYVSQGGLI